MSALSHSKLNSSQKGFSLVEVAMGLVILSLIAVGLVATVGKQSEQRKIVNTRQILDDSRAAVLAFSGTNGRLPCPSTNASGGQEAIASNVGGIVVCQVQSGFLPAVTLGMSGVESSGLLNDGWTDGAGNAGGTFLRAIRYGITSLAAPVSNALTSPSLGAPGSVSRRTDIQLALNAGQGIFVCRGSVGVGVGVNRCGSAANMLAGNAVAVVWSAGVNGGDTASYSADENQNFAQATQRVYISRTSAPQDAVGGSFDDLVTWISYPLLADRLVLGGFAL